MHEYINMIGRSIMAFIALLLISRILGKQTISNMTFHDFATGITMGALAANVAFNILFPAIYLLACLAVLTIISYFSSILSLKFPKTRHLIAGAPTMLIDKGNILEANMRKIHYTIDSLNQSLREKNIFNLDEVEFAMLETNGQLSIKKKEPFLNLTKQDLKIAINQSSFPVELVMDGIVMKKNLDENNLTEEWLLQQISNKGKMLCDVFYAVRTTAGNLVFDYYNDEITHPIDKE